ncbi:hypothetical protein EMCRGX_G016873 [Ephydatia muelleri]
MWLHEYAPLIILCMFKATVAMTTTTGSIHCCYYSYDNHHKSIHFTTTAIQPRVSTVAITTTATSAIAITTATTAPAAVTTMATAPIAMTTAITSFAMTITTTAPVAISTTAISRFALTTTITASLAMTTITRVSTVAITTTTTAPAAMTTTATAPATITTTATAPAAIVTPTAIASVAMTTTTVAMKTTATASVTITTTATVPAAITTNATTPVAITTNATAPAAMTTTATATVTAPAPMTTTATAPVAIKITATAPAAMKTTATSSVIMTPTTSVSTVAKQATVTTPIATTSVAITTTSTTPVAITTTATAPAAMKTTATASVIMTPTTSVSTVAKQATITTPIATTTKAGITTTIGHPFEAQASINTAAISASVVVIIVLATISIITVVAILLYIKRSSKTANSSEVEGFSLDNAVYGTGMCTNDVATTVYEPVKDNEIAGENDFQLPYEVPSKTATTYSGMFHDEQMPAENIYGNDDEDPYCLPPTEEEELYGVLEQHKTLRIPRHEIETKSALGHGQFGGVHKGKWKSPKGEFEVAIKVLDPTKSHNDEDKVKFLQEAAIMAQFKHPNVILFYGIVSEGEPLMLVIELAHNKDLRTHLTTMRPDPGQMILSHVRQCLLTYSQQVALGMQYLSNKSFVHRDLAARNVLVTKACVCKIADFGLSRNLDEETYYFSHGGMVPVKWTAPEAVCYKKYSTASDVWSFGCVLYEIWSLGFKPFETISNAEVVMKINAGYRLPPPPGCPLLIYETMIHCWGPDHNARPSFRDIHMSLFQDQDFVLHVPEEAASTHPQAAVLGAPLEAGEKMYIELQKSYT